MTKKESLYVENLLTQSALRATSPVAFDVPIPTGNSLAVGFSCIGSLGYSPHVEPSCSYSYKHYRSAQPTGTGNQRGIEQYSTELLALRSLRYQTEQECAKALRAIDRQLEECIANITV